MKTLYPQPVSGGNRPKSVEEKRGSTGFLDRQSPQSILLFPRPFQDFVPFLPAPAPRHGAADRERETVVAGFPRWQLLVKGCAFVAGDGRYSASPVDWMPEPSGIQGRRRC